MTLEEPRAGTLPTVVAAVATYAGWTADARLTVAIDRGVRERAAELRASSVEDYYARAICGAGRDDELALLAGRAAIHETYFFRAPDQVAAVAQHVAAAARRHAAREGIEVVVWTAGCATGEETYSVAMALHAHAPDLAPRVRVVGTDLAVDCVTAARRGWYGAGALRALPDAYRGYFRASGAGFELDPVIRSRCEFRRETLHESTRMGWARSLTAIVCRNVLLYFDEDARTRTLASLAAALRPGGVLVLGPSELALASLSSLRPVQAGRTLMFARPALD